MNFEVAIEGAGATLRLQHDGVHCRFAYGQSVMEEASVIEVEPGIYSVLWNGKSYEAKIVLENGRGHVDIGGRHYGVTVSDPRELATTRGTDLTGRAEVVAPMPGKVVRVLVEEGAEVEAGQGIVVVEAMKMQNEMSAPIHGRVAVLRAREGAAVTAGELLATIE